MRAVPATVTDVFVFTERKPRRSILLAGCVHSIAEFLTHGKQHGTDRGQEGEGTQETGNRVSTLTSRKSSGIV